MAAGECRGRSLSRESDEIVVAPPERPALTSRAQAIGRFRSWTPRLQRRGLALGGRLLDDGRNPASTWPAIGHRAGAIDRGDGVLVRRVDLPRRADPLRHEPDHVSERLHALDVVGRELFIANSSSEREHQVELSERVPRLGAPRVRSRASTSPRPRRTPRPRSPRTRPAISSLMPSPCEGADPQRPVTSPSASSSRHRVTAAPSSWTREKPIRS